METLQGGAGASKKRVGSRLKKLSTNRQYSMVGIFYAKMRCGDANMLLKPRQENKESQNCILTIDGMYCFATVWENTIAEYGLNRKCEVIKTKFIFRKYILRKPFPYFIDGIFEIVQDYEFNRKCYMSDDRTCLIEV